MLDKTQIYVIVDIETDGPVPGLHSMLSIGAVSSTEEKEVSSFYRTLRPYKGAKQDPDTMEWWSRHPDSWQEVTASPEDAEVVIKDFYDWVEGLGAIPVFVASPLVFDFGFTHWYLHNFVGANPFIDYTNTQRTLDLASFTAGKLGLPLSRAHRSHLPASLRSGAPEHSHKAIDDARGYGVLLRNILQTSK